MSKIKQIRQRTDNGFGQGIPLGADGINIDMSSGLNLEEELKLGGNHYIEISENTSDNTTHVQQWYYDISAINTSNISSLENFTNEQKEEYTKYYINSIISTEEDFSDKITFQLYNGFRSDVDQLESLLLYKKTIIISPEDDLGTVKISEGVTKQ